MPFMHILAALILPLIMPPTHATTAVVFSESTGRWGVTWNEPNKQEAVEVATERCRLLGGGKDCKPVKVTDERGFGAVANTCAGNYCGISVITGRRSAAQAERDAIKDCNSYYGTKNCYVLDNWEETGAVPLAKVQPSRPIQQPKPISSTAEAPTRLPEKSISSLTANIKHLTSGEINQWRRRSGRIDELEKKCSMADARECEDLTYFNSELKKLDGLKKKCLSKDGRACLDIAEKFLRERNDEGISFIDDAYATYNKKACDLKMERGCFNLDIIFSMLFQKDIHTAVSYYEEGCNNGYSRGCFSLGILYDKGNGVRQDYQKAAQLYQKACDMNHSGGCLYLAEIYNKRESGLYDSKKALQYYGKMCYRLKQLFKDRDSYACNMVNSLRGSQSNSGTDHE